MRSWVGFLTIVFSGTALAEEFKNNITTGVVAVATIPCPAEPCPKPLVTVGGVPVAGAAAQEIALFEGQTLHVNGARDAAGVLQVTGFLPGPRPVGPFYLLSGRVQKKEDGDIPFGVWHRI